MVDSYTGKWKFLSLVLVASLLLAACGGSKGSSDTNTSTSNSTTVTSTNSPGEPSS